MAATDVATAIDEFHNRALRSFNDALRDVDSPPGDTPEKRATALTKAKGEMAAALQQLITAETMRSDKRGREGYKALVALMESTQTTAASIYIELTTIAGRMNTGAPETAEQLARNQQVTALAAVLEALANIAPVAVWKKAP